MEPLVSTAWVAEHLGDHDLRILDATVDVNVTTGLAETGRARWEAGHVPGAAFADLLVELSDPDAALPFHDAVDRTVRCSNGAAGRR